MLLIPKTILDAIAHGGSVRIRAAGQLPDTMKQYAAAAKSAGGFVEFVVGDAMLLPQTLNEVSATGAGHVRWDFVSKPD